MEPRNVAIFWTIKHSKDWSGDVREWIREELRHGRLRQGWAPPGSSLTERGKLLPFNIWSKRYIKGASENWDHAAEIVAPGKVKSRYRILSLMTKLKQGDLVLIPRVPEDDRFTIAAVTRGYEFMDEQYAAIHDDLGHMLHVDPNRLVTRRYDSDRDSRIVVDKFSYYRNAVTSVKNPDYISAVVRLWSDVVRNGPSDEPETPPDAEEDKSRKGWSGPESEWHKSTVVRIAAHPELIAIEPASVARHWCNSCEADDGRLLWRRLRTGKRPDVVFELRSGTIVIVEVEPFTTYFDGLAQLAGDYRTAMLVDRRSMQSAINIEAVLVIDTQAGQVQKQAETLLPEHAIRVVQMRD
jgi:hypothetical protein